jgi:fibronectin-binding autotransporter adhesin
VTLDAQNGGAYQILSGSSNALANLAGNAGSLALTNATTLNTVAASGFTNTGTVTTAGTGANALNVTGNIFNTSPGVVNLNGSGDKMTATGQFTNTGAVNLNGNNASVSSFGLDNQSGGTVTLAGNGNGVSSTGAASNEGTIAWNGTNGSVSSTGNFTNAASGIMTVEGTGNELFTNGNLLNSGGITIGNGGIVTAALGVSQSGTVTINANGQLTVGSGGEYDQTGGTTAVNTSGTLSAPTILLQGGTLTGGGTIEGNLTVAGGTLNPGDPQTIDVIGNYDQTLLGILDIDLAGPLASPSADQVHVTGNVILNGTLDLTLESGFDAALGAQFNIINWTGSETANFSSFNNRIFDGNRTFQEVFNGNQVDLVVVSTVAPTAPEPSTLAMLFCAMLMGAGITWRIRRREIRIK